MFTSLKKKLFGSAAKGHPGELTQAPAATPPEPAGDASTLKKRGNAMLEQGKLTEAAQCYRQALALVPIDVGALVNLGFVLSELRLFAEARTHLEKATLLDPKQDDAFYILGNIQRNSGNQDKAIECFRRTLELKPDFAMCRLELCRMLFDSGDVEEAKLVIEAGLALQPDSADLHYYLGNLHLESHEFGAAITSFKRAISILPEHDGARRNLGGILQAQGDLDAALKEYGGIRAPAEADGARFLKLGTAFRDQGSLTVAAECFRSAIAFHPPLFEAHRCLGSVLQAQGMVKEAIACHERAILLRPDHALARNSYGTALQGLGKLDQAIEQYRRTISLSPAFAEAHRNLGAALQEQEKFDGAMASYERALQLDPADPAAHINMGTLLRLRGNIDGAKSSYRAALVLMPDSAIAHSNLGSVLQETGEHDAAIKSFQKALMLVPDYAIAQNNLLFTLNYHPDKSAQKIFAAYCEYDNKVGLPLRCTWREHANSCDLRKRLKVGYVSPDFRLHAVRHFLEPLLARHDKSQVEVFAYAELAVEDATTTRYRGVVDHWIPTVGLSDEALAERIRADGIDILLDLAGHTSKNRLGVFARKPAPVSLSWLGFGYTTGLSAIDYMLTDGASTPEGSEDLFAEQLWRLATPGYVYRPANGMGEVSALPAQRRGFVTFGTLTRAVRINHRSITVW